MEEETRRKRSKRRWDGTRKKWKRVEGEKKAECTRNGAIAVARKRMVSSKER